MCKQIIKSEFIQASIAPYGAELKSLVDLETGIDYLWQGSENSWNRSSPILFPIVGALKEDKYRIKNKYYPMSQHGFARDMQFELISKNKDQVQYRLESTEETLKIYPFRFRFNVTYKVYGPKVIVHYEVRNIDKKEMLFSLGSHPGFNIPFEKDDLSENYDDYYLEFQNFEKVGAYSVVDRLVNFNAPSDRRIFKGRTIPLTSELFNRGALIFKDPVSERISIKSENHDHFVTLDYGLIPYLGIWSLPGSPFVCLEPWYGVADSLESNHDFYEKEGLMTLNPSSNFKTSYTITIG